MENVLNYIKAAFAVAGAVLGGFLGGLDGMLTALLIVVAVDYITGVTAAIVMKNLSSEIGAKGIAKKVFIFLLVGIAHAVDIYLIQKGSAIRTAVIMYYFANEGLSILENAGNIGLDYPPKLKAVLKQLKSKSEEDK